MAVTTINIDKEMGEAMEELRLVLGVTSNTAVLKRAVALLRIGAKAADEDGSLVLLRPDGREMVLPLRF